MSEMGCNSANALNSLYLTALSKNMISEYSHSTGFISSTPSSIFLCMRCLLGWLGFRWMFCTLYLGLCYVLYEGFTRLARDWDGGIKAMTLNGTNFCPPWGDQSHDAQRHKRLSPQSIDDTGVCEMNTLISICLCFESPDPRSPNFKVGGEIPNCS